MKFCVTLLRVEQFKPQQNNIEEKENSNFFSKYTLRKLIGDACVISGGVFVLAGIYEFCTKENISHLIGEYKNQLPDILNSIIDHIDHMPVAIKAGGGASLMKAGQLIRGKDSE
jgi:hypothetical protein